MLASKLYCSDSFSLTYYIGVISYNIFLDLFFFAFNKVMLAIKNAGT